MLRYTDEATGLRFKWAGGHYIDIASAPRAVPFDVINVFGKTAPFRQATLNKEAMRWINGRTRSEIFQDY